MQTKPKKKFMGMNIYHLLEFFLKRKIEILLEIGNKKTNITFWNFID
jgi:hypothetical protein